MIQLAKCNNRVGIGFTTKFKDHVERRTEFLIPVLSSSCTGGINILNFNFNHPTHNYCIKIIDIFSYNDQQLFEISSVLGPYAQGNFIKGNLVCVLAPIKSNIFLSGKNK